MLLGGFDMAANLQYNVYRFFEYWQQGIDSIFGSENDNSDQPVLCPFYRDGDVLLYASETYIGVSSGYSDYIRCYARCTITNESLSFFHDFRPIDYLPNQYWTNEDIQESYQALVSRVNDNNFILGMDENHVGEHLYSDNSDLYQFLRSENSNYPLEMDWLSNKKYGTIAIRYDGLGFNIDTYYSNPFEITNFGYLVSDSVGTNLDTSERDSLVNNYNEYNNHYTEDGITVYYSDDYTYITYDGEKTYNQVQNVVNNAYNNDNSVTIKINAPSYDTLKNGEKHPYYIAPVQPLQVPELGEMSLPSGDFGDSPKILAESVNEMTGILDHLGLTTIFIICALLIFIIRKVRD